ncbi:hypothetical protein EDD15DRAFT_2193548 [Pisolithus albus]|nr:hypothetical protein EDD15DRAFT_2193548 [Pisolithus albus]
MVVVRRQIQDVIVHAASISRNGHKPTCNIISRQTLSTPMVPEKMAVPWYPDFSEPTASHAGPPRRNLLFMQKMPSDCHTAKSTVIAIRSVLKYQMRGQGWSLERWMEGNDYITYCCRSMHHAKDERREEASRGAAVKNPNVRVRSSGVNRSPFGQVRFRGSDDGTVRVEAGIGIHLQDVGMENEALKGIIIDRVVGMAISERTSPETRTGRGHFIREEHKEVTRRRSRRETVPVPWALWEAWKYYSRKKVLQKRLHMRIPARKDRISTGCVKRMMNNNSPYSTTDRFSDASARTAYYPDIRGSLEIGRIYGYDCKSSFVFANPYAGALARPSAKMNNSTTL